MVYANTSSPNTPTGFAFDYMLKDHLGNVRMVLTDEVQPPGQYVAATLEPATINNEALYYGNLSNTQFNKPTWFNDPLYSSNTKVARLKNATGVKKIGPNMLLKVMAGDSYNIRVASGWSGGSATNSSTNVLNDLFSLLTNGVAGVSGGKATATQLQNSSSGLNAGLTSFMAGQTTTGSRPKAYLSWVLLDEQFKIAKNSNGEIIASGYSGFQQVGASGSATFLTQSNLSVAKSGYLYIYTSNEATNIDVFFDNLQVVHKPGPILEETHYYPFGLTMAGISSKALNGIAENKYKYNDGTELNNDLDINLYETRFRGLDPQTGRWLQIDPMADSYKSWSPYVFALNNPVLLNDPTGLASEDPKETSTPDKPKELQGVVVSAKRYKNSTINLISRTPTVMENIVKEVPWSQLTSWSGERIDKYFRNYINKHPDHYRYLASKYIDMRWAKHGNRIVGAGEIYDAMASFLDYGLAAAENQVSPLPDPTGISTIIASDLSADLDESILSQSLTLAAKGIYSIEGLGRVFSSLSRRGHGVPLTGTYVSSSELLSIYLNGGIVNPNLLMFKNYGFTDIAPSKEGVNYNHFILYNEKTTLPITEK